jgi:putative ABC transport system permease protein
MKTFDLLDLAVRNIRESMLRNVLTTVGIGVGVASLVSMLSLGIGLQELASSRMNQSGLFDTVMVTSKRGQQLDRRPGPPLGGEVESEPEDAPVLDEAARRELAGIPEVLEVYPEIRFAAEAQFEGKTFRRAVLSVPSSARETESFRGVHGTFFSSEIAPEALLQDNFAAELLGWKPRGRGMQREAGKPPVSEIRQQLVGKTLRLRFAERVAGDAAAAPDAVPAGLYGGYAVAWRELDVKIVGIVERDPQQLPGPGGGPSGVMLPLRFAEGLHAMDAAEMRDSLRGAVGGKTYTMLTVKLRNASTVAAVQDRIKALGFNAFSIVDATSALRTVFLVMDSFLGAFGSLALTVASIGIVNTLVMAILERRREIGTMKALGASDSDIRLLFFAEAGALGAVGGAMGVTLGWLIGRAINFGVNVFISRQGLPPQEIWYVPWWLVAGAILFSIGTSLLAGWYPAAKASKLDPIQALRYE